jgi:hypothetical protein
MSLKRSEPLPVASSEYSASNEDLTRRMIQSAVLELRIDLENVRGQTDKDTTLAMRRSQFLLMGA